MEDKNVVIILQNWDIIPKNMISVYETTCEIDGKYILKRNHDPAEIEKSLLLSELLKKENIPVAQYLKTNSGKGYIMIEEEYYCLMYKLNGTHLDVYASNQEFPEKLGQILSKLHISLKHIEAKAEFQNADLLEEWNGYILPEIADKKIILPKDILEYVKNQLEQTYPLLPRQLIHRDPHMGNLLFEDEILTGYIDFDLSVRNTRVFDLCYFALSFLIGNTEDTEKGRRWKNICNTIFFGYEQLSPLSELERSIIKAMMLYIELLFVAFWSTQDNKEEVEEAIKMAKWIMDNVQD